MLRSNDHSLLEACGFLVRPTAPPETLKGSFFCSWAWCIGMLENLWLSSEQPNYPDKKLIFDCWREALHVTDVNQDPSSIIMVVKGCNTDTYLWCILLTFSEGQICQLLNIFYDELQSVNERC